jgi:hypothetical protein
LGHFGFQIILGRLDIGLASVESFQILGRIRLDRVSDHLVPGHFRFRVILGRDGLGIGSSSVGSFHISDQVSSDNGSSNIGSF